MRLTSIAAGILVLAASAYPLAKPIASRASALGRSTFQESSPRGPLIDHSQPSQESQTPQQQEPPQSSAPLQVQTTVVNVFTTVRDRHNGIISDLSKNDFKVFEDGVEQKISYFTKEVDLPLSLALLMDTSGSMQEILNAEKEAASNFVEEVMHKKDEAIVMSFDTDVNLLADFSEDPGVLQHAIRRAEINVDATGVGGTGGTVPSRGGGTNLYDAVYLAAHDELTSEAGRKAIILLTDAEDTGSKLSENDAIESAQRADAVLHFILIIDPGASEGYGPGVASKMAHETGGRVISVRNDEGLRKAFDTLAEELRSQYVIGYYPANTKHDGTFRKIRVDVDRADLKILARKGYYAPSR
jgi:VWFA-related protein